MTNNPKMPLHHRVGRAAKLAFIPHKQNDYRPHLIRRYGLIAILLLVLIIQTFHVTIGGQISSDKLGITDANLLSETNVARKDNNLPPLALNSELSTAAREKAQNMLDVGYWSHNAPNGTTPWTWITNAGYNYRVAGENLARDFDTADEIMKAWLESPKHRANIMDAQYQEVGFAAVDGTMGGRKTTLVVAMYARPMSAVAVPDTSGVTTKVGDIEKPNIWTRLVRGVQSSAPSLMFILVVLGITTCVAVLAHTYRKKLPEHLRKTWYRHHALIKLAFIIFLAVGAILSYGGGMI
jgi:hypothetical protein